jgi:2-C-methyl-D-erythritol 4-phosphate cytidylyltransferase
LKKYAIIVAAGSGSRMGSSLPKQFLLLQGKPVLWHTINTFLDSFDDMEVILVVPRAHFDLAGQIVQSSSFPDRIKVTIGGDTRFQSVKNGLSYITEPSIVLVHDGVRCLVTSTLIHYCYEMALVHGNAVPSIASIDSIRIEKDHVSEIVDREKVRIIQTPQAFQGDLLKRAFDQDYDDAFTDEASVVERLGIKINLVEGEAGNIKITRPIDLVIAEKIIEERNT